MLIFDSRARQGNTQSLLIELWISPRPGKTAHVCQNFDLEGPERFDKQFDRKRRVADCPKFESVCHHRSFYIGLELSTSFTLCGVFSKHALLQRCKCLAE